MCLPASKEKPKFRAKHRTSQPWLRSSSKFIRRLAAIAAGTFSGMQQPASKLLLSA
jgi:hypothetical protein